MTIYNLFWRCHYMPGKKWTVEDIVYLENHIGSSSFKELAAHFKVSTLSIASKASKLGLSRKQASGELWSTAEDDIIKTHFEYAPKDYLMDMLPRRTWPAIYQRGNKTFKLSRKTQDHISLNYNAFSEWNEFTAYVVGFVLADGHIRIDPETNEKILQIQVSSRNRELLELIASGLDYKGTIGDSRRRNASRIDIRNKKIVDDLVSKGIPFHDKTHEASFPNELPLPLLRHFVRGVFDGDGSAYLDQTYLAFELLGTKKLLSAIQEKCAYFLGHVSIYDRSRSKKGANVHCIKTKGRKAVELFAWLYQDATIYFHKKYNIYSRYINEFPYRMPGKIRTCPL